MLLIMLSKNCHYENTCLGKISNILLDCIITYCGVSVCVCVQNLLSHNQQTSFFLKIDKGNKTCCTSYWFVRCRNITVPLQFINNVSAALALAFIKPDRIWQSMGLLTLMQHQQLTLLECMKGNLMVTHNHLIPLSTPQTQDNHVYHYFNWDLLGTACP